MGSGNWDTSTYRAYSASVSHTKSAREVFTQSVVHHDLDVRGIKIREARDSADHPISTPIIFGLDVTGSMGTIAHEIAKNGLGRLVEGVLENSPVVGPQFMMMAIGDVASDDTPVQATQFESDARITQQLTQIFVEGGGGGNNTESYDMVWQFAATRTVTDHWEKRNKKGYIFTFGDELFPTGATSRQLKEVYGPNEDTPGSGHDFLKAAQEKWNVFHIVIEEGSYARGNEKRVVNAWKENLGSRVLPLSDHRLLPEVVVAALRADQGVDVEEILAGAKDAHTRKVIAHALSVA